jgi:hypothetical protein
MKKNSFSWRAVLLIGIQFSTSANADNQASVDSTIQIVTTVENTHKVTPVFAFSGFIKHDVFYDTRQTVNAREALVTLYPQPVLLDAEGRDINANPSFNMLNIHSRLRCMINGPTVFGASSLALVEADFYGNENKNFSDLNGLRLFNAYIQFNWRATELKIGQDWHPMSIQFLFPGVVSFSAGAPFHPMSRNPQIRLSQQIRKLRLSASILSQRDFTSTGPEGPGSQYLRNSGIPNIHVQAVYGADSSIVSGGIGIDYKQIVPELFTSNAQGGLFKTGTSLKAVSFTGFLAYKPGPLVLKAQGVYAQNSYDLLMLGGYGVSRMLDGHTGRKSFISLNTLAFWIDTQTNWTGKINIGLFNGYTANLGANESIQDAMYARGEDIKSVYRIAPRIVYANKHVGVSVEGEYMSARYGTANGNGKGLATDTYSTSNLRILVSTKYTF